MANLAYNRSCRRERELVNTLRADGWIAARSAGSKSEIDVWGYHKGLKEFRMYQIKTKKGGRGFTEKLMYRHEGVTAEFWWLTYA